MRVLVACEFSGVVRDAFLRRGHDAWSCDIVAGTGDRHIRGSASPILKQRWDLIIAHPPCTYICKFGWISMPKKDRKRKQIERTFKMLEGIEFFLECWNANAERICVENPIPVMAARKLIGEYSQLIQPWQYGHPYTKATCFWLKNLPDLIPTNIVEPTSSIIGFSGNPLPEKERPKHQFGSGRMNSLFHIGVAKAMADQWGNL